jgi:hypothetical protein
MADQGPALEPALKTVEVRITAGQPTPENPSGIVVDKDPFYVSKKKDISRLQVEWICSSEFTVEFENGSPFGSSTFTSKEGRALSGRVKDDVNGDAHLREDQRKNYKYTVTIPDRRGRPPLDPGGIVDP